MADSIITDVLLDSVRDSQRLDITERYFWCINKKYIIFDLLWDKMSVNNTYWMI